MDRQRRLVQVNLRDLRELRLRDLDLERLYREERLPTGDLPLP